MKKSKAFLMLGAFIAIAFSILSFTGINGQSSFRLKQAQASDGKIVCDCALLGGNDKCLANNYGSSCAPDGTTNCQDFNANCEDDDKPQQ